MKNKPLDESLLEKATVTLMVGALDLATKMLPSEQQPQDEQDDKIQENPIEHSEHFRKPR